MKKIPYWLIGLAAALLLLTAGAIVIRANPGDLRSRALQVLGDERRNQIVAFTSRLNARQVETADMVPMRYSGVNPLGVNTFLEQEAEISKRRATMQMIKDAGIGWIRQQFPWEDIEVPSKGQYWDEKNNQSTWDKYDNIVDLAQEYGLQLIVRLDLPPKWAHPNNLWPHTPPENFDDYGDFVYTVVKRYKGKVKYYQLWNEPNLAIEWGSKPVDAREYVRLLKIGYQRAKEADPDCVILSAALAPTIEESWQALNEQIYLQQMYDAGAKDYFDIMSVMAYGLRSGPDDRRLELKDVNFSRPILTRETMVRNGDASKPIWASEMGWNAQPESVTAEPVFGRVSEELQAQYTVRAFQRVAEEWPWMGVMDIWFFKRADDRDRNQPFYYFRMAEPDLTPLPVYEAIKEYGSSTPPTIRRGYWQEDHWALSYQGDWSSVADPRAGEGRQEVTGEAGASVSTLFQGTELALVVPKGPAYGSAYLEIDGSPRWVNLLPIDASGNRILNLSSPDPSWQQVVPIATGLNFGVHSLEIRTTGPFALDGVIADTHDIPMVLRLVPPLASVAILGAALALAIIMRRRTVRRREYRLS